MSKDTAPEWDDDLTIAYMAGLHDAKKHYADEIERLRSYVSRLARMCNCEPHQCKVYGEDELRFSCEYRKARAALGEGKE